MDAYDLRYALDEAYEAGSLAGHLGKPESDNPYPPGEIHDCWRDGWRLNQPSTS